MKHIPTAILIGMLAGTAGADTVSTSVEFNNSGYDGTIISFDAFDDLGGTRQLTGVTLSYNQTMEFDLTIESNGYTAVQAGDWVLDAGFYGVHQLGVFDGRGGDGGPNYPVIGTGGVYTPVAFTGDLGASDGYNQSGPDTIQATFGEQFVFDQAFDNSTEFGQRVLDTLTGTGQVDTFLGSFTDLFVEWINDPNWVVDPNNPPDGPFDGPFQDPYYGIFVTFDRLSHYGTLSVSYEYTAVPTPSGLLVLGGAGLIVTRRRR